MILGFRTDRSGQTVQTQFRLLLEEQSDQGLRCLLFLLHHLNVLHQRFYPGVIHLNDANGNSLNFRVFTVKLVRKFRNFTVDWQADLSLVFK